VPSGILNTRGRFSSYSCTDLTGVAPPKDDSMKPEHGVYY
jgi:hypothetical protein